jgi:hypothetical protein
VVQLRELCQLLVFPVEFMDSEQGHEVSSEEALILTALELVKGYTNVDLAEYFRFSIDTVASQIYG